jgi:hypothetical protein
MGWCRHGVTGKAGAVQRESDGIGRDGACGDPGSAGGGYPGQ